MILETDEHIKSNLTDFPLTPENLLELGATRNGCDRWLIVYKGISREFRLEYVRNNNYEATVYVKHYTNDAKTSWLSFGAEYAHTLFELLAWYDAEEEFYKDHPEEKEGTPEYKRKQKREEAISEEFERLRWNHNQYVTYKKELARHPSVGYGPNGARDETWYILYGTAIENAKQKHPELFE